MSREQTLVPSVGINAQGKLVNVEYRFLNLDDGKVVIWYQHLKDPSRVYVFGYKSSCYQDRDLTFYTFQVIENLAEKETIERLLKQKKGVELLKPTFHFYA